MYDTARRVEIVKRRVRENSRRKQRCGIYGLSAVCLLLFVILIQTMNTAVGPGQIAVQGIFGAIASSGGCGRLCSGGGSDVHAGRGADSHLYAAA